MGWGWNAGVSARCRWGGNAYRLSAAEKASVDPVGLGLEGSCTYDVREGRRRPSARRGVKPESMARRPLGSSCFLLDARRFF